jgi:hypothetical protein
MDSCNSSARFKKLGIKILLIRKNFCNNMIRDKMSLSQWEIQKIKKIYNFNENLIKKL